MNGFEKKCEKLQNIVKKYTQNNAIIAFSGGADSSLLLKIACEKAHENGKNVYSVTFHTMLHPAADLEITQKIAKNFNSIHKIIEVNELENAGIMHNPKDRCYLCKKHLFSHLCKMSEELGITDIMDGTNADDLNSYRPGILALRELGIKSPLAEAGMTKQDVRQLLRMYGISVADRPSSPCLATRFPYGTNLTYENMRKVEKAEEYIKQFGFYNVRFRVHGDIARIEVDSSDIDKLVGIKDKIVDFSRSLGYKYVTLDLEGFSSGSMDK